VKQLRSYQSKAFARFADALFFCLNFACGLGKTFTAAVIAEHKKMPTIVIAPNTLCGQWRDELIEMGVDPEDIFIASAPEENKNPEAYAAKFKLWLER
jgi:superfamily II DNA or RNA helicase